MTARAALPHGRASVSDACSLVNVHSTRRRDREGALLQALGGLHSC